MIRFPYAPTDGLATDHWATRALPPISVIKCSENQRSSSTQGRRLGLQREPKVSSYSPKRSPPSTSSRPTGVISRSSTTTTMGLSNSGRSRRPARWTFFKAPRWGLKTTPLVGNPRRRSRLPAVAWSQPASRYLARLPKANDQEGRRLLINKTNHTPLYHRTCTTTQLRLQLAVRFYTGT